MDAGKAKAFDPLGSTLRVGGIGDNTSMATPGMPPMKALAPPPKGMPKAEYRMGSPPPSGVVQDFPKRAALTPGTPLAKVARADQMPGNPMGPPPARDAPAPPTCQAPARPGKAPPFIPEWTPGMLTSTVNPAMPAGGTGIYKPANVAGQGRIPANRRQVGCEGGQVFMGHTPGECAPYERPAGIRETKKTNDLQANFFGTNHCSKVAVEVLGIPWDIVFGKFIAAAYNFGMVVAFLPRRNRGGFVQGTAMVQFSRHEDALSFIGGFHNKVWAHGDTVVMQCRFAEFEYDLDRNNYRGYSQGGFIDRLGEWEKISDPKSDQMWKRWFTKGTTDGTGHKDDYCRVLYPREPRKWALKDLSE